MLRFEWDPQKARSNLKKHGVSFSEAMSVFGDPLAGSIADPKHSGDDERFIVVGMSARNRLLVVVHSEGDDSIRIISARHARPREKRSYEHG